MALVLVVEDDSAVREMVADALAMAGLETITATEGYAALNALRESAVDLVVSDVNMPKMDGFELLQRIRSQGNQVPFLLLTARDQKVDIATGFRSGADDYVSKPFGLEELLLRVQALLRRSGKLNLESRTLSCGPVSVNLDSFEVTKSNGELVELSNTEFRLLVELMSSKNKVLGKAALLDRIWGYAYHSGATVLDTYVSYLRKKLHDSHWQGIKTVRGVGYKIVDDAKE